MPSFLTFLGLALVFCIGSSSNLVEDALFLTPLGYRPSKCVHQIEEQNHIINTLPNGVEVEYDRHREQPDQSWKYLRHNPRISIRINNTQLKF